MITSKEIQNYADGKVPEQIVVAVVQAPGNIVPSVVLNVYLNLDMTFLAMQASFAMAKSNLTLANQQQAQPEQIMYYFFTTTVKNFEKYYGPYHPNKVLPFTISRRA